MNRKKNKSIIPASRARRKQDFDSVCVTIFIIQSKNALSMLSEEILEINKRKN